MQTTVPFANVPIADFADIILDGGERADEAAYYLLQHILYQPLKRHYEVVRHQLLDDFNDILDDFFFYLRDGNAGDTIDEDDGTGECGELTVHFRQDQLYSFPYPSIRRIRNRQAFLQWMLRTFRNYLNVRAAKDMQLSPVRLDTDSVSAADIPASTILTDEQKLSTASNLLAYAHQELSPRDGVILLRTLLTMLDKRQSLPNEEMAEALGMTDVTYRVTVHRVKDRLAQLRARLLQGEPVRLDEPHRQMAQRINEDFLHLYPTLLYYYTQSVNTLDTDRADAVNRLRRAHLATTGDLLHEPSVPYETRLSKAMLWNLVERVIGG